VAKATVNGCNCIILRDKWVDARYAPFGYPDVCYLRHSESDWTRPESIERFVLVNLYGTMFSAEPFLADEEEYIEVSTFEIEDDGVAFVITGEALLNAFAQRE
jgi:hypothetical protein